MIARSNTEMNDIYTFTVTEEIWKLRCNQSTSINLRTSSFVRLIEFSKVDKKIVPIQFLISNHFFSITPCYAH